jgi:hypothetical protein
MADKFVLREQEPQRCEVCEICHTAATTSIAELTNATVYVAKYNPVVFPSAGIRAVFSEVVHFTVDSDKSTVGGFVFAVFWKLFFLVSHCISCTKKCQMTLFIRNTNCLQARGNSL